MHVAMALMLLAAQPSPTDLGMWLLGLGGVLGLIATCLGIAIAVKKLFERKREEELVTRGELAELQRLLGNAATKEEFHELKDELKTAMASFATKGEVSELKEMLSKESGYIHDRFHKLSDVMQPIPVQVGVLTRGYDKFEAKLDLQSARTERLLAILEQRQRPKPEDMPT
jgi:hypothetical protein